ncbi:hypothetical protein AWB79_00945 [Caballeronia hypogeia]|uniref:Lipoprotein n=1 Tax=Caballeronia hypogeia TaxID=1777140 RepID=A0A157ZHY9_9BURK|nr:hypothetical protein [Caballeronia hypogeia]SAK45152.1 hypothetical protein AWB79_00945 [Caballeronia hypogeia]
MQKNRNRALCAALVTGIAGLCFATAASADSQAAKKMGQMGVINQTLQSKPARSSNAYSNSNNANTANPSYNANSTYNPNAANAADANTNAGATGAKK